VTVVVFVCLYVLYMPLDAVRLIPLTAKTCDDFSNGGREAFLAEAFLAGLFNVFHSKSVLAVDLAPTTTQWLGLPLVVQRPLRHSANKSEADSPVAVS
jgi:hypothetical protein